MRRGTCMLLGLSAVVLSSCSILFGVSDDVTTGVRTTPDGGGAEDAPLTESGAVDVASDGPAAVVYACAQTDRGPPLVAAGDRLCIDRTEVTFAQYDAFLDAGVPQSGRCADINPTFAPRGARAGDDFPVHGVDWCDAMMFCEWAGKKLCGAFPDADAGTVDATLPAELSLGQAYERSENAWLWACGGGDAALNYPYGNDPIAGRCFHAGGGFEPIELGPVASRPCEGGFPGIFDMTGNVVEWISSCGENDFCQAIGIRDCRSQSGMSPPAVDYTYAQTPPSVALGFRCCGRAAPFVVP